MKGQSLPLGVPPGEEGALLKYQIHGAGLRHGEFGGDHLLTVDPLSTEKWSSRGYDHRGITDQGVGRPFSIGVDFNHPVVDIFQHRRPRTLGPSQPFSVSGKGKPAQQGQDQGQRETEEQRSGIEGAITTLGGPGQKEEAAHFRQEDHPGDPEAGGMCRQEHQDQEQKGQDQVVTQAVDPSFLPGQV